MSAYVRAPHQKVTRSYWLFYTLLAVGCTIFGSLITASVYAVISFSSQFTDSCGAVAPANTSEEILYEPDVFNEVEKNNSEVPVPPTLPRTAEDGFVTQEQKLANLPHCIPMLVPVWLQEELNQYDSLTDQVLVTTVVAMERCPHTVGLCYGESRCHPTKSVLIPVSVNYVGNNTLQSVEREVRKDLKCECR